VASMVTFPTASGDGQGMLALPRAPGPGVLLLPDYRGLAPDTVAAAQRLARVGCPTLAVDFFHRVAWRFGDFDERGSARNWSPRAPASRSSPTRAPPRLPDRQLPGSVQRGRR
jgi:dienelactone hydrolase